MVRAEALLVDGKRPRVWLPVCNSDVLTVIVMKLKQFQDLASQDYNRIPLTREILADLDTPLSTYIKLAGGR